MVPSTMAMLGRFNFRQFTFEGSVESLNSPTSHTRCPRSPSLFPNAPSFHNSCSGAMAVVYLQQLRLLKASSDGEVDLRNRQPRQPDEQGRKGER
jgi:hypothetical protein